MKYLKIVMICSLLFLGYLSNNLYSQILYGANVMFETSDQLTLQQVLDNMSGNNQTVIQIIKDDSPQVGKVKYIVIGKSNAFTESYFIYGTTPNDLAVNIKNLITKPYIERFYPFGSVIWDATDSKYKQMMVR